MRISSPAYPELLLHLPSGRVVFKGGEAKVNHLALEKEVREYASRGLGFGADIVILDDPAMDDPAMDEAKSRTGQKK